MLISIILILFLVICIGQAAISTIANRKHLEKQMNNKKKYKKEAFMFDTEDRNHHHNNGDN
ncbi:hypothetical protein CN918_28270 [Priestia megaterium]|nr:hypothetical protein CN918_28270 [Priestia megaterium]